jgi:hypothetical protein
MQADEIKQVVGAEKDTLHKIVLAALQNFTDNTGLVVYGMAFMERSDIGVNG